jgi:hypothetical protein
VRLETADVISRGNPDRSICTAPAGRGVHNRRTERRERQTNRQAHPRYTNNLTGTNYRAGRDLADTGHSPQSRAGSRYF